jgi:hypothetical protein
LFGAKRNTTNSSKKISISMMADVSRSPAELESRGWEIVTVALVFSSLATIVVALRIYVRLHILKKFGLDDWFIVASLVSLVIFLIP